LGGEGDAEGKRFSSAKREGKTDLAPKGKRGVFPHRGKKKKEPWGGGFLRGRRKIGPLRACKGGKKKKPLIDLAIFRGKGSKQGGVPRKKSNKGGILLKEKGRKNTL